MPYTKEVVSRARARLAQQKADRESLTAARLQEAYIQVPRLRQIDAGLRQTMAAAAQAVFSEGGDVAAAMEKAKQENQALQAERKALEQAHFTSGWLDETPICKECGGSGYVGAAMCKCLKALCVEEQRKELGSIFSGRETFDTFRLDYYSDTVDSKYRVAPRLLMQKNLDSCIRYARSFSADAPNLLLVGGTGLGKTHLALAVGRAVGEQGYTVCYETAISLFAKLEQAKFVPTEESRREAERVENCDLLIVDDLGTEMPGQFINAALYGLLNHRLMLRKPMVITTNINIEDAAKRYTGQIASRLYGEFTRLSFIGSDIRILKNKEH